jgi:hypothetical protein
VYFAYGANMDRSAMARRCPASKPLMPGRLMNHRFIVTSDGFASVRREQGAVVHGLLWDLALKDVCPLDRFEEVGKGLYTRVMQPIVKAGGAHRAMVYVGKSVERGNPQPGYMESVVASAEHCGLPDSYLLELRQWLPQLPSQALERVPSVRPRFATPFDR